MNRLSRLLRLCLVSILLQCVLSMPSRPRRQSFFRCSGWGAGCTNMDYEGDTNTSTYNPSENSQEKEEDGMYGPPFLFTSGSSWGAIGKRSWGSTSWHADPYLRRMLLPYVLSSNHQHHRWVQKFFPEEYKAIQSQLRRRSSLQVAHRK
ncbi:uncharacterized protein LOC121385743 [Gigantopelta aegis]|uniref:uncharacterized protein LOC121385743 n=1 Tax=Gigantopelta aegis TaxID=1735272 RepID=UPI001B887EC3|nr:uncharacterized protein LOC121385743 [Gigantopelta aegis]